MSISSACVVFFFQAEDGIRDLVRSRGLGDVYKRQAPVIIKAGSSALIFLKKKMRLSNEKRNGIKMEKKLINK